MPYFQPDQIKTIRQQWIPGVLQVLALAVIFFFVKDYTQPYVQILYGATFFVITAWTFIQSCDWPKLGIYAGVFAAAFATSYWVRSQLAFNAEYIYWHVLNGYLFIAVCILARQFLSDRRHFLKSGLLLWALMAIAGSTQLNYFTSVMNVPLSFGGNTFFLIVRLIFASVIGFSIPYVFHGQAFLIRNYLEIPGYKSLLKSKVLVTGKNTYLFLYPVLFMTTLGCATQLPTFAGIMNIVWESERFTFGTTGIIIVGAILGWFSVFCLVVAVVNLYLIRNVVTGRMLTIQQSNGLVYAMHFIPLLNIISVLIVSNGQQAHHTTKENAQYYLQRETSTLAHWIVILGIIFAVFGIIRVYLSYDSMFSGRMQSMYMHFGMGDPNELRIIKYTLLTIIAAYAIKVLGYFLLYNHRKAVFFIVTMNILLLALSFMEALPLALIFSIAALASLFVLLEIFHPALHDDDALLVATYDTE